VRASAGRTAPQRTTSDVVQWDLWSSTFDGLRAEYHEALPLPQLRMIQQALGGAAEFTPRYFVIPGHEWFDASANTLYNCTEEFEKVPWWGAGGGGGCGWGRVILNRILLHGC
jgi:hypothetical protein